MTVYRKRFEETAKARRSASRLSRYYGAVAVVVGSVVLVTADKLTKEIQNALILADWSRESVS